MRERIGDSQGWRCEACGGPLGGAIQLAHRIPQNVHNLKRWGAAIIHDRLNMAGVCSLDCNSKMSIGGDPMAMYALAAKIKKERGLL